MFFFKFRRQAFMTCKLLWLGSNVRDYDRTLHRSSLFNQIYYERVWNIYNCFKWKTNTCVCKLLRLRPSIQDYNWTLHPGRIFLPIYCERNTCFESLEESSIWNLQAITVWV